MPRRRFTAYNVLGAIAWTTGLLTVGFYLGGGPLIAAHVELCAIGMVALSLIPAVIGLARSRRTGAQQASPPLDHATPKFAA